MQRGVRRPFAGTPGPINPKFVLTRSVVYLMGMEQMCYNMMDYPEEFDELLCRMTDDYCLL